MITNKDVDLLSLQTNYMKKDKTTQALCAALTPLFNQIASETGNCLIYPNIDNLSEELLDELAWQRHIDWYDVNADIGIKRKLIKSYKEIHKYRGTPYAVEEVIKTYFGDGTIKEWFEYGGEPFMFKVVTANESVTNDLADQFIKVLDSVKNKRSHLEKIELTNIVKTNIYSGAAVHVGDYILMRQVV